MAPTPSDTDLARARAVLLDGTARGRRLSAEGLRAALVDLHDFWLTSRAGTAGLADGTALIAVGGLGRRDLAPYSDLDLVLLHDGRDLDRTAAIADAFWYPLWDAGVGLDHSVRTVADAVQVSATDLRAALGLLEARVVVGDPTLANTLIAAVGRSWRAGVRDRVDEIVTAVEQRWERSGEIAHRVEPNLKDGRGGLRDVHLLDALAAGQLVDRASIDVRRARDLLLDVRTELHRHVGRAVDVVRAQDADEVATALGIGDRFDLARALSGSARTVAYAVDVALRAAKAAAPVRGRARLVGLRPGSLRRASRGPQRRPLDDGVVEHAGEVALARDAHPLRDPALALRVAATAARTGLPVAAATLATLADSAPELRAPWPRAALDELLSLLGAGHRAVAVVEAMDRTGLWGRLFPEWGAVRDLPPRDRAHVWTVDRHLVETAAHAARLTTAVSRPDLLLIGALLHDIGKGRGEDHSVLGAALAERIGTRLGLWPSDVTILRAVVRHHLLLPHTATRRDPADPATAQRVVDTLTDAGADTSDVGVTLELLAALAEADSLATGPGVWTRWRASLVGDLVTRCRAVLAGVGLPAPDPLTDEQLARAVAVAGGGAPQISPDTSPGAGPGSPITLTITAPRSPGLLSCTAGVLALHSLQVHQASLRTTDGVAVDTVVVSPRFGSPPDVALLRQDLVRALDGSLDLSDALATKERDYGRPADNAPGAAAPRVLWFDDEATGAVVMELRTTDRIGLLHAVATALENCAADVSWARVSTLGSAVVDSFCLRDADAMVLSRDYRARIERAVLAAAG